MLAVIGACAVGYAALTAASFGIIRKGTVGTYRVDEDIKTAVLWPFLLAMFLFIVIFNVGDDDSAFDRKA